MNQEINENLKKTGTWKRIFFMLVFAVILGFVRIALWAVVALQIISTLLTGSENRNVLQFSQKLAMYVYNILMFLTYNSERMPFPFSDWEDQNDPLNLES